MALSVERFRQMYPEFARASDEMLLALLRDSAREVDAGVWGDEADTGVGLLTAHRLQLSPFAQGGRIDKSDQGWSIYGERYEAMVRRMGLGPVVV